MKQTKGRWIVVAALGALLAAGCAGDIGKQIMSNPELQTKIMGMIAANTGTAGQMVDQLLASDSVRTVLVEKVMANGPAAQAVMAAMAKNQTMIDGVLNVAVQDPAMKDHVMTLFKGMQMTAKK